MEGDEAKTGGEGGDGRGPEGEKAWVLERGRGEGRRKRVRRRR